MKTLVTSPILALPWVTLALLIAYVIGDLLMRTSKLAQPCGPLGAIAGLRRS